MKYDGTLAHWMVQLRWAQEEMRRLENELIKQDYVNTIHDCWEKVESEEIPDDRQA